MGESHTQTAEECGGSGGYLYRMWSGEEMETNGGCSFFLTTSLF